MGGGEFTVQARYLGDLVDVAFGCRVGRQLGDLVDVAVWGNVPCVSKIDTLDFSTVYYKCFLRTSVRTHISAHAHAR